MVTLNNYGDCANVKDSIFWGLSTDEKPKEKFSDRKTGTNIPIENGSIFIEMDTKNVFIYDRQNMIWHKFT